MKYVILRCEDRAWGAHGALPSLLQGAKASHLQQVAQAGAGGLLCPAPRTRRWRRRLPAAAALPIDRFAIHRALLGCTPEDPSASAGRCYAAGANLQLGPDDVAWSCELITQREGTIIDPTAGRIPTKESALLIHALDERLGSQTRRWEVGEGAHHVLILTDSPQGSDGDVLVHPPQVLTGQPWRRHLPRGPAGDVFRSLIEDALPLLEAHPINRVRVDLGENPANMVWLWGGARRAASSAAGQRPGFSRAVVSSSFPLRGMAKAAGFEWQSGPASFEESALHALEETIGELSERFDLVYVHLAIETHDPVARLCAVERIDQMLLKPLMHTALPRGGPWRVLVAIDDCDTGRVPFAAIGHGLANAPVVSLDELHLAESPLAFHEASDLFSWFTA